MIKVAKATATTASEEGGATRRHAVATPKREGGDAHPIGSYVYKIMKQTAPERIIRGNITEVFTELSEHVLVKIVERARDFQIARNSDKLVPRDVTAAVNDLLRSGPGVTSELIDMRLAAMRGAIKALLDSAEQDSNGKRKLQAERAGITMSGPRVTTTVKRRRITQSFPRRVAIACATYLDDFIEGMYQAAVDVASKSKKREAASAVTIDDLVSAIRTTPELSLWFPAHQFYFAGARVYHPAQEDKELEGIESLVAV